MDEATKQLMAGDYSPDSISYPKHITGTWGWSGAWLGSYRLIAEEQDIIPLMPHSRDIICPECAYPEATLLSLKQAQFQCLYFCPECGSVWGWYVARCPECDKFVWNKDCPDGMVKCSICGLEWGIDFVKEFNEDPDFHQVFYSVSDYEQDEG